MTDEITCYVCGGRIRGAVERVASEKGDQPAHPLAPEGCIAFQLRRIADAIEYFSDEEKEAGTPGLLRDMLRDLPTPSARR